MMDVDHFKLINDTYGHKAGDRVLKKIAETCQKTLREIDIIGRVGGEEFALLLPETDIDQAMDVAERLREEIAKAKVEIDQVLPINFSISIGVTTLTPQNENIEVLLNVADKALYVAKDSGRNRVVRSAEQQLEV
jgi:diguanylate cyclase (GGDEF)-like protein